ncbi:UDP-glucose 4-epimerase GalE [Gynuella sunshinyii]|uniref:UDP-glucose 4-epimerase n=1 Tax=Gynuella sunshinyii YC6258 TaxID=1445510 RepID=A0A0C5VE19_9GAMM|nr:UDP-glucose 4-epimerase GalE [Gynuella sunshinyii]AJQ92461.1 UDP-glucose 4-epimerase [Gynuella sunshinyii YC6258]
MTILVTGGAGYIGSHTCIELVQAGHEVIVLDNFCNSSEEALKRAQTITGKTINFVSGDIRDRALLDRIFQEFDISSVIHFAGLKAVGESTRIPLSYYDNNVGGTITLCEAMAAAHCKNLVFSSSATVYGDPHTVPITEEFPLSATNPYGRSKLIIEDILRDLYQSDKDWNIAILRYFNPVGAHESGQIGEDPSGIPNNLMPFLLQVAVGRRDKLSVFGDDYDTPDGTGVRDYIHVVDLARGHLRAIEKLSSKPGCVAYNLGTGRGYSVLEMIQALEKTCGKEIAYEIVARRPGDIACCYADPAFAEQELGWKAERGLEDMMADSWKWQSQNPKGYLA